MLFDLSKLLNSIIDFKNYLILVQAYQNTVKKMMTEISRITWECQWHKTYIAPLKIKKNEIKLLTFSLSQDFYSCYYSLIGDLNGSGETNGHVTPDNTEIIRISGRKEDCEAAAQALKALVPINIEVSYCFSIPSHRRLRQFLIRY